MMAAPAQSAWIRACRGKRDNFEIEHPFNVQTYSPRVFSDFQAMTCLRETDFHCANVKDYVQTRGRLANALLQARAEILGGQKYPGVKHNILCALVEMDLSTLSAEQCAYLQLWHRACPDVLREFKFISPVVNENMIDALWLALNDENRFLECLEQLPAYDVKPEQDEIAQDPGQADAQQTDILLEDDASEVEMVLPSSDEDQPGIELPEKSLEEWDGYKIFDQRFDQVVAASQLAGESTYADLRTRLVEDIPDYELLSRRLVNRLRRVLLALQRRSWLYDQEEGWLNPARLASWVASADQVQPFRQETESQFTDTAVSLLLDCSGSMRGQPVLMAAACIDVLTRALEQCSISVEVLGYTSGAWDDGPVVNSWNKAGRPQQPGRLNALQHVVFKPFTQPWRRARHSLAAVLNDDWMRENIDGEALWWAYGRLQQRYEKRRILLSISDGLPRDKMTCDVNGKDYLERHLRDVISEIEEQDMVELHAIGVGHAAERFYLNAVSISQMHGLAEVLTGKLTAIFTATDEARHRL